VAAWLAVAVVRKVPEAAAVAFTVTETLAALASAPRSQLIVPPETVHPEGDALTTVIPDAMAIDRCVAEDAFGPAFRI
jgi:hypothetical protein